MLNVVTNFTIVATKLKTNNRRNITTIGTLSRLILKRVLNEATESLSGYLTTLSRQRTRKMAVEHCCDNRTMSQKKMRKNPDETLELCRDITKFVATKAGKSSQKFVAIIVFMSRQNLPRSAVRGKERMPRHLKLCRDISKFCHDRI